jgi:ATP-dependent DNA helicase DinG
VVTSATLSTGGRFDFMKRELGLPDADVLQVPSPFDIAGKTLLITPPMPAPTAPQFSASVAHAVSRTVELARGRTLGLFTSYANLRGAARQTKAHLKQRGLPYRVLVQGDAPRTELVRQFKEDEHAVLLGTQSFWAGVDVPGSSLSCVVIDRLPFASPQDHLIAHLRERGACWFHNHSLPRAITAFRQGFGRLLRHVDDHGVVVLLDNRLSTKNYGARFLADLPTDLRRSNDLGDIPAFLDRH